VNRDREEFVIDVSDRRLRVVGTRYSGLRKALKKAERVGM